MGSLHPVSLVVRRRRRRLVVPLTRWRRHQMLFPAVPRRPQCPRESRARERPLRLMAVGRRCRRGRHRHGQLVAGVVSRTLMALICLIRLGISVSVTRGVRRGRG